MLCVLYVTPSVLWKYSDSGVEGRRIEKDNLFTDLVINVQFSKPLA